MDNGIDRGPQVSFQILLLFTNMGGVCAGEWVRQRKAVQSPVMPISDKHYLPFVHLCVMYNLLLLLL